MSDRVHDFLFLFLPSYVSGNGLAAISYSSTTPKIVYHAQVVRIMRVIFVYSSVKVVAVLNALSDIKGWANIIHLRP
jgi:hypothetical protein